MGKKTDKQVDKIYKYMKDFGSITQLDAIRDLGVMRLASRISEMRMSGIAIKKEMETGKNRYGEPTHYARYSLD
ncbi:MAG: helix-turn-helix domain-containing protein [Eubacterium sp.]|nr:helix-turn-helix domain-containing protein [Eubacterium sp.]